jgi:GT2 family glycosyltransferase
VRETLEKTTYGKQARIKSAPFWAALLIFTASIVKLLEALRAWRLVRPLYGKVSTGAALEYTKLSVVIPACNEERKLEGALRTVLGQDYPNLEVILVNDRSTDGTGRIMERLAAGREGTAVIHVEELPEGWLGKNHAVRVGAERACGDWLLLTDADVRFHPATLRRAVAHAETQGLDHLTLIPELRLSGYWLRSFVAFFYAAFLVLRGYYKANVPSSKTGVGIGAFNLIRRGAYQKAGGYEALANRPDDDLTLGDRVKKLGMRQELALGHGLIEVEWYSSLGELFRGVEKNTFAALGYSFPRRSPGSWRCWRSWPGRSSRSSFPGGGPRRSISAPSPRKSRRSLSATASWVGGSSCTRLDIPSASYFSPTPWPARPCSRWLGAASTGAARSTRSPC